MIAELVAEVAFAFRLRLALVMGGMSIDRRAPSRRSTASLTPPPDMVILPL
ncbi:hypothetical protein OG196_01070 [Kitasatospora purpeofusca]|uniref:hypothetical protein n=1 Tax=Kitasatospora purpeofusca TaxID=67352 RepID=UPI002E0D4CF4|nr:hypothetical protein OG196_01070 [Kitasatospora purpeofusca]